MRGTKQPSGMTNEKKTTCEGNQGTCCEAREGENKLRGELVNLLGQQVRRTHHMRGANKLGQQATKKKDL